MPPAPTATSIVFALELLLLTVGTILLWRCALSPQARTITPALPAWEITPFDFLFFFWLVLSGGFTGQLLTVSLPAVRALPEYQRLLIGSGGLHLGLLAGVGFFALRLRGRFAPNPPAPDPDLAPAPSPTPLSASTPAPHSTNIFVSGFATFLISLPVVSLVGFLAHAVMQAAGLPLEKQTAIDLFRTIESPLWRFVLCFLPVVVAPLSEELIFRAGLFRFVRTRLPRWAALALPACVFAAIHGNLASFAQLTALGILFSLAYERTGRIGTSMVAHALFNFHTVLFLITGVEL